MPLSSTTLVAVWLSGSVLASINKVTLCQARLVRDGWLVQGSTPYPISIYNQPPRSTQPGQYKAVSGILVGRRRLQGRLCWQRWLLVRSRQTEQQRKPQLLRETPDGKQATCTTKCIPVRTIDKIFRQVQIHHVLQSIIIFQIQTVL